MSRRTVIAIASGMLSFAGACTSCTPNPCASSGTTSPLTGTLDVVVSTTGLPFFDHSAIQAQVAVPTNSQCLVPESVSMTVTDPNNQPVESNASLSLDKTEINVTFESGIAGWYYLSGQVQPNIGLAVQQLLVTENQAAAGAASVPTSTGNCTNLGRTLAGTWVCDGQGPGLSDNASDVVGNVVWTYNDGSTTAFDFVQRYVDDAGTLTATLPGADGGAAALFGVSGIAATDDDALFVHGNELFWYQYDAGSPVLLGTYVLGLLPSSAQTPIQVVRQGPVALAAADTTNDFILDAGTFTACVVLLGTGGMTDGGCLIDNGALVGADDAFLWVVGDGSGRLSAYGLDGGAIVFAGSTPLSPQLTPPSAPFPWSVWVPQGSARPALSRQPWRTRMSPSRFLTSGSP